MILVDTSVWIDHFRANDGRLHELLDAGRILTHPFVVGEIALGHLRRRDEILLYLRGLPQAVTAADHEVLLFIDRHALGGLGIGYVDAHLLAAAQLTPGTTLWTRDERLSRVAKRLGLSWTG